MEALEPRRLLSAVMVSDINPTGSSSPLSMVQIGATFFFRADDGTHGYELWKSDGTDAGTMMVKDICSGSGASYPQNMVVFNGSLYFSANDGAHGYELWKSDGTDAGTVMVKDIRSGSGDSTPTNLTNLNGTLFFTANDGTHGFELWKSDGTSAGTMMFKDIYSSVRSSAPKYLADVNGTLFFQANEGTNGPELWKSDGTDAGTVMVKDIRSGTVGSYPSDMTNVNGMLFFLTDDGTHGRELWKSDGTDAGTVMVKDIRSGSGDSVALLKLTNINGTLFFTADDGTHGQELWKSDGTDAGTVMVKDINPSNGSSNPNYLTNVNGTLFFQAYDNTNGSQLWKSDGTDAGTVIVKDVSGGSGANNLANFNGTLFFQAHESTHGYELWKSDGTDAGTVMVKDINPDSADSSPHYFTNVNGALFFSADDGTHGEELWVLRPPTAVAGDYTVKQNSRVDLSASGSSDPDSSETLTYQWDLDGDGVYGETGSAAARGDEVGHTPTFKASGLTPGDYALSLRVTNSAGLSDTAAGTVTVTAAVSVLPVGSNAGTGPEVKVHRPDGTELTIDAFGSGFDGGVKTASGDLTGDGTPDIIVAAGAGGSSHIRIFNGTDGTQVAGPLGSFVAFAGAGGSVGDTGSTYWTDAYNGPVLIASGDVNGDGIADIVVAAGEGGSSHVKIFDGADGTLLQSFLAFPGDGHADPSDPAYYTDAFQGGVNVAMGDVNNDGEADLIAAAGPGAGPQVKVFAGGDPSNLLRSFFAYDPAFRGGVNVAGGDVDGDGFADILTAPQSGAGPNVKVFSGADGSLSASFWAYDPSYHGGVALAGGDYDSDGAFDLITRATGDTTLGMKQFTFADGHTPTATDLFFATS